jgi:hypothetical protein
MNDRCELFKRVTVLEQKRAAQEGGEIIAQQNSESHKGWIGWIVALAVAIVEYFAHK